MNKSAIFHLSKTNYSYSIGNNNINVRIRLGKDDFDKGQVVIVNWSVLPIGKSFALHYHESLQEVFIIFKGKVKAIVNGEEMILESGDGLIADINEEHTMENISNEDVIFLMFGVSDNPSSLV